MADPVHKIRNNLVVIGSGIIGLSVATIIQNRYPDIPVTIYSSNINESTTSWGSAGFLRYFKDNFEDSSEILEISWLKKSADHFWDIFRSGHNVEAGVLLSNFYYVSESPILIQDDSVSLYEGFRYVNEKELRNVGFSSNVKYGVSFISTMTESRYYLPFLMNKFKNNGGTLIQEKVTGGSSKIADWALKKDYNVVINCSGLGSRELFGDDSIIPMRGQIVRVDAPWMKYSFLDDNCTYAFAGKESMILGGYRQKNDWDFSVRQDETSDILRRISKHNVSLANSKIIEEWTGLRPWRRRLRLEIEYIESSDGIKVPVVHNYGHGSSGIGLSWGTSLAAVDLLGQLIL